MRTLAVASVASAVAAVVVSRFWTSGTPIAAAITPVIVTIVSEFLHRPAERIAERFTTQTYALPQDAAPGLRPPGAGAQSGREDPPPPARNLPHRQDRPAAEREPARASTPPRTAAGAAGAPADDVRVYRSKQGLPWKAIAITAALAFAIGATVLTFSELIAGQSAGKANRSTTLWGGASGTKDDRSRERPEQTGDQEKPAPQQTDDEPAPKPEPDPKPGAKTPEPKDEGALKPDPAPKAQPGQTAPAPPPPTPPPPSPQPPTPPQ